LLFVPRHQHQVEYDCVYLSSYLLPFLFFLRFIIAMSIAKFDNILKGAFYHLNSLRSLICLGGSMTIEISSIIASLFCFSACTFSLPNCLSIALYASTRKKVRFFGSWASDAIKCVSW